MTNETHLTENLRIVSLKQLITPTRLKAELPLGNELTGKVLADRQTVRDIIHLKDPRLLIVIGPCSIHDPVAALDYARRLSSTSRRSSRWLPPMISPIFATSTSMAETVFSSSFSRM